MAQKVVFITATGAGTYTIPADFGSLVSVEAIGGGGSGSTAGNAAGGGGGAYSKSTTMTGLSPGLTVYYNVGAASGDSWLSLSNSAPSVSSSGVNGVLAKGGTTSTSGLLAPGGVSTSGTGDVRYSGGSGAAFSGGAGGGGGAAGPGGIGGNGSTSTSLSTGRGGGGGGASLTAAGSSAGASSSSAGGAGGNGGSGTGGGAGGTSASNNGVNGTAGTGGGGGGSFGISGGSQTAGTGATGSYWTQTSNLATAGSGGGGGGNAGNGSAAAGGLYGGGGGGGANTAGIGAQGIIVFTYNTSTVSGFKKSDDVFGTIDLDDQYVTDSWLVDKYVGGSLFAWGANVGSGTNGQGALGQGYSAATLYYSSPLQVGALTNWKAIDGDVNIFAIKNDGTLWGWGAASYGALGVSGTVSAALNYSSPLQVGALTNWKQVMSPGYFIGFGVTTDGKLWSWGYNQYGSLGQSDSSAGTYYLAPTQIGTLNNWNSVTGRSVGGSGNRQIVALATKLDGTLWAWGWNSLGGLGLGTVTAAYYSSPIQVGALTNWKQVSAGALEYAAIKTDGTLWMWGHNAYGQLGQGYSGNIYYSSPIQVGSLNNWKQVSVGQRYVTAIKTDGTLWGWGQNTWGQLGLNNTAYYSSPVQVGSLTNWKQVSASLTGTAQMFTSAVKTDGTLWTWGTNFAGQLGQNNSAAYYSSPVQVGSLTNWKQVHTGFLNTYGITFTDLN